MSYPWIFITPSSRGIGANLTRYLLRTTTIPILATVRTDPLGVKDRLLQGISSSSSSSSSFTTPEERLTVLQLDVTDESTIETAAHRAAELFPRNTHHLRLAFALPGILHAEKSLAQVDVDKALMTYRVNTLGPLLLMKWFGDFLPRKQTKLWTPSPPHLQMKKDGAGRRGGEGGGGGAKGNIPQIPQQYAVWTTMSARVGSTSDNRKGGWYSYRSSKAAVNSLTKTFDHQLVARSGEKAMALAYHPGTVRTDLSRDYWATVDKEKLFEPEFAVERMVEVVTDKVGLQGRGRCWDWQGQEILP